MDKKITIIGNGIVGSAMTNMLKDHYTVLVKDINTLNSYENGEVPSEGYIYINSEAKEKEAWDRINSSELAVVCVPTNMNTDGSCDTSIVEDVVSKLETPVILIKSTIEPGTVDRLKEKYGKRICFSPEYAGESAYYTPPEYQSPTDMKQHPYVIIGGEQLDRKYIIEILIPVLGPTKKYFQCSAKEAEAIKYFENSVFASKIIFANEMRKICEAFGIDYYTVREGWLLDPRICPMHTLAMPEKESGGYGFGGKCLIKDTNALIQASKKAGYNPKFLQQIMDSNIEFRNTCQTK